MTPVWNCGFECGVNAAGSHIAASLTNASFNTSIVRSGSRSMRVNPTAALGNVNAAGLAASNTRVARFYVRFETIPSSTNTAIFGWNDGSSNREGVWVKVSDGKIYAGSTTSNMGSTGVDILLGKWHMIDLKIVATADPHLIDVSVDGVPCGQCSHSTAGGLATTLSFGIVSSSNTADLYFDDIIVSNTAADYPIGHGKILPFIPTSDGTHNIAGTGDFQRTLTGTDILNATTTAYQLIDDIPLETGASVDWINLLAPPNATDYVECIFGPASGVPTPTYGPRAVDVIIGFHQSGTGTGNMEVRLNDNGSMGTIYTATGVAGVTSVAYARAQFADPPSAATVWGVASGNGNFNNVRMRFGSPAAVDANPDQYLDCIMIEAEFAEWPQKITNVKQAVNRSNTY